VKRPGAWEHGCGGGTGGDACIGDERGARCGNARAHKNRVIGVGGFRKKFSGDICSDHWMSYDCVGGDCVSIRDDSISNDSVSDGFISRDHVMDEDANDQHIGNDTIINPKKASGMSALAPY
jgi:hypothetical protein